MLDVNAEEVQTDDGAEEAGERLLRASQGVEFVAAQLAPKASQESLRSLGPPPSDEHGRDQSKYRSVWSSLLSLYAHMDEGEEGGAKGRDADRQSIISVPDFKLSGEDDGPPTPTFPAIASFLEDVERRPPQRVINVSAWDTEPSPLHRQHFEINGEYDRVQQVEWIRPKNGLGGVTDSPTLETFDRPRPSTDSTLTVASNTTATPTNTATSVQMQHAGMIPALNLTVASPIAPQREVEISDGESDSPLSRKPRSQFQPAHPSSNDHRPSMTPPHTLSTAAAAITVGDGDCTSVLTDTFMSVQESSLRAAREAVLKSKPLSASPTPGFDSMKGIPQPMRRTGIGLRREKSLPPLPREDGANSRSRKGQTDESEFQEAEYGGVENLKKWEPTAIAETEDSDWCRVKNELG